MNITKLWTQIKEILSTGAFRSQARSYDRRSLIEKSNNLEGPPMMLLHWEELETLKRIPHSSENRAVDALIGIETYGAGEVEIFMVSHRWLQPSLDPSKSHPDTSLHEKAKAIREFSLWRRQWVQNNHGFLPEIFYWIDYCCIDQTNTENAVPLLPLWVACCERFLRIETPDYHERAWCRIEPLLGNVFSFTDHQTIISTRFRNPWPNTGQELQSVLLYHVQGLLTNPEDISLIQQLVQTTLHVEPANPNNSIVQIGETSVKCFKI